MRFCSPKIFTFSESYYFSLTDLVISKILMRKYKTNMKTRRVLSIEKYENIANYLSSLVGEMACFLTIFLSLAFFNNYFFLKKIWIKFFD